MAKKPDYARLFLYMRELKNWRQKDLAEAMGVSQSWVSKVEGGSYPPTADNLMHVAEKFPELFQSWMKQQLR